MKRFRSDTWLALGLILLMVVVLFAAALHQVETPDAPTLASFSNAPAGGRALRLWLQALKFEVSDTTGPTYFIPAGTTLVLLLEPDLVSEDEWQVIDRWVKDGGVLLLAGSQFGANLAARHFDFNQEYMNQADRLLLQVPVIGSPPLRTPVTVRATSYYTTHRTDYVSHLGTEQGPVVVSFPQGKGQVILCAAPFLLTNEGLKEPGSAEFVLHLLSSVWRKTAWFDEWHHGQRGTSEEIVGFEQWLPGTPAGQSSLYSLAVIFIALALSGRAFGRPLPLPRQTARRAPLEYITALAYLSQRAGHRRAAMRQYYTHLKRELGRRYRLDPTLPDPEYVAELKRMRPELDAVSLLSLLQRLQRTNISEREMVHLADEASNWIQLSSRS